MGNLLFQVHNFSSGATKMHSPHLSSGGHGGGDEGLTCQFVLAMDAIKNHGMSVLGAQMKYIGCTLRDVITSHALVFAAEQARVNKQTIDWKQWWKDQVENRPA
jgi:hypothetical protein